jgi:DNA-binding transcriptional MocR family regulator
MRRHPSREPPLHADPTRRPIVLGPKPHELRAYVGSTAWVVLEEMMQRSTGDGDHVVAEVSIRSLASSLGLAKDTVNRAARQLRDLGVIRAEQHRSDSGVFQIGSYVLDVPTVCLTVDTSTTTEHRRPDPTTDLPTTDTTSNSNTTKTSNTTDTEQLTLTFNS